MSDFLRRYASALLSGGAGLVIGSAGMAALAPAAVAPHDRAAIEAVVHDYILAHPEIITEAMTRLDERRTAERLSGDHGALEKPFAGAWAGSATPDVTLVMFTDYSCGFCRASVADVDKLLGEDRKLRVVWREIPILGPQSEVAARVALAAAETSEGQYLDLHRRIFAGGVPSSAKIDAAAKGIGLDPATLGKAGKSDAISAEIKANLEMAERIGVSGTPAFVIGKQMLSGAVGYDALKQAIADARKG